MLAIRHYHLDMPTLFVATSNAHKLAETQAILGPSWRIYSPRDTAACLDVAETGTTFEANASIKALAWAKLLNSRQVPNSATWVLADDSGLEVDALGGEPGVHSARYAALDTGIGGNSPDPDNTAKLLSRLSGIPGNLRTARFRCVLALVPASTPQLERVRHFSGVCNGRILKMPTGTNGFGYDPVFVPEGETRSFSELEDHVKNTLSHRGKALAIARQFLADCQET